MKSAEELKCDIVFDAVLRGHNLRFHSTWGLVSPRGIASGSSLLLENLHLGEDDVSLDLGCGYGAIGLAIAKSTAAGAVHMIDKDFIALAFAKKNAEVNGIANCKFYPSNALSAVRNRQFDNIVSNLPAQVGRELLYIIVCDALAHLRPGGQLVVVTISGLREFIKRNFKEVFGNYRKLKQGRTHTVAQAVKEQRPGSHSLPAGRIDSPQRDPDLDLQHTRL